ncbi:MAG: hypothetical protein ACXAC2_25595 [Candidatus Kariarchaeaceae archaeon]|jgi:hypothetical protein
MNQDTLEHFYVTGDYSLLLEEISKLAYNHPSTKLNDVEKAICVSYHSRALIRLGEINEAGKIINRISNTDLDKIFSISTLIYQTSVINLQIARGDVAEALKRGLNIKTLVEQHEKELSKYHKILSFWSAYLYYLVGQTYFYQYKIDCSSRVNVCTTWDFWN